MIRLLRSSSALLLICLLTTLASAGDSTVVGTHPKIGLVLEGGGALGLAHIRSSADNGALALPRSNHGLATQTRVIALLD